jgi:hypothetical protein
VRCRAGRATGLIYDVEVRRAPPGRQANAAVAPAEVHRRVTLFGLTALRTAGLTARFYWHSALVT